LFILGEDVPVLRTIIGSTQVPPVKPNACLETPPQHCLTRNHQLVTLDGDAKRAPATTATATNPLSVPLQY
jgi:hypothetical protein